MKKLYSFSVLFLTVFFVNAQQGTWTQVATLAPNQCGGEMMLLTDGSVMCKTFAGGGDGYGNTWQKLTPTINGSYVNGTWSVMPAMSYTRLYLSSQILKDGRVYVAGGEYGTGGGNSEIYNPVTNSWTTLPSVGQTISDANSEILDDGRVLQALVTGSLTATKIYNPANNTYVNGPSTLGIHNESAWLKLPDNSILFVNRLSTNSERYIPSTNQWINDATVPVQLYDPYGDETGGAVLLPDGRGFFLGSSGNTAFYTPSGNMSNGTWAAGPTIPNASGTPDAACCIMVNGRVLCAVSPLPTSGNHFPSPTTYYVYDYVANNFTQINAPAGGLSSNQPCYYSNMLQLPNGQVLYGDQYNSRYYVFTPNGTPQNAWRPTIANVIQTTCDSFKVTGTLFNGMWEGACYGDDWQMETNYPIVRLTNGTNVYYCRSFNWNHTGVRTGNLADTTKFKIPTGLPWGTYQMEVIANGIASNPVSFTPYPILSSSLNPPAICSGTAFTYTPTSAVSGATFTWTRPAVAGISNPAITIPQSSNPNEVLINTTTNPVTVTYVYVITANNCSITQNVTVVVNPSPAVSIAGTSTICSGNSTTLTASGATTYSWSTGATTAAITITPTATTSYTVTGSNTYSCSNAQTISVTVNPTPTVTATSSASTTCAGDSVSLNANGATTYVWSNSSTGASIIVNPTVTTTYTVTGTDGNGCSATSSVSITVNPLPAVTISGTNAICTGSSTTLTANGASTYVWSNSATTSSITVSPTASTSYTVTGTDSSGCSNTQTVTVTVNPLPNVTLSAQSTTTCINWTLDSLSGNPSGGTFSGTGVSGNNFNASVAGTGTFTITYTYTDGNGCTNSATTQILVNPCTGIASYGSSAALNIYPNPTDGDVTILLDAVDPGSCTIQLVDVLGQEAYREQRKIATGSNSLVLHLRRMAPGFYTVVLRQENSTFKGRILVR